MKKQRGRLQFVFLVYFGIVLGLTIFPPAVRQWNQIHPHIFGLPLAQFCILLFAIMLSAGLILWYILEGQIDAKEAEERARSQSREL